MVLALYCYTVSAHISPPPVKMIKQLDIKMTPRKVAVGWARKKYDARNSAIKILEFVQIVQ